MDIYSRTEILIGKEGIDKLKASHVAVFGLGGVGGYVCEALVRAGVGILTIVDSDTVDITNINRQIIATNSTIGQDKTKAFKKRIEDINPDIIVNSVNMFYLPENKDSFDFTKFSYVVDAIDTVTAKINLVCECINNNIPIISSMGMGNKIGTKIPEIMDISKTKVCPLAKTMRLELRARGINHFKVCSSEEIPVARTRPPGSISFVPGIAGLLIAGEVIRDLIG